jgi:cytochrome b6-f complex iron-sulfur subunit
MPSNDPKTSVDGVNRRGFIGIITRILLWLSGLGGVGGLVRFLSYQPGFVKSGRYTLEPPSAYPAQGSTLYAIEGFVLYRDEQGFFARSLVCPHLGCVVQQESGGFKCPCHGSGFGQMGELLNGPARKPLKPIQVELDQEGRLVVDVNVEVAWDWRLNL